MMRNRNACDHVGQLGRLPQVPPTPSIVRLRNPGFPRRGFFVSAPFVGHHHIDIVAPALRTDQPIAPIGTEISGPYRRAPFRLAKPSATAPSGASQRGSALVPPSEMAASPPLARRAGAERSDAVAGSTSPRSGLRAAACMIPVSLSSADDQGLQLQLKSGSQLTRRWRKADSNPRSRRGKSGRSERCGINPRSFGPRERHQVRRGTNGSNPACSSGESAANLNFGGEARVAGSGPDRRVLRRGLDWLAVLVVYCFGLGGLVFLS